MYIRPPSGPRVMLKKVSALWPLVLEPKFFDVMWAIRKPCWIPIVLALTNFSSRGMTWIRKCLSGKKKSWIFFLLPRKRFRKIEQICRYLVYSDESIGYPKIPLNFCHNLMIFQSSSTLMVCSALKNHQIWQKNCVQHKRSMAMKLLKPEFWPRSFTNKHTYRLDYICHPKLENKSPSKVRHHDENKPLVDDWYPLEWIASKDWTNCQPRPIDQRPEPS